MKILHLANHAQLVGNGIVNVMVDLACMQAQAGNDVTVASSGGGFEPLLARHGVRHVPLSQSPSLRRMPAMLASFNRLIREFDPEIVHAHMMTGALIARFGVVRRRFVRITTVHNEFQKSATLMRFADRVVAVTDAVAESMAARGIPRARLCTIRNGTIGSPRHAGQPAPSAPALRHPCVTTVAGMYERKGIGDLLRAFAMLCDRFPDATLYLVGDGPDRAKLEQLARDLQLEGRVTFAGFVANPAGYIAESDVFVLASHVESGPLVLSEARELGRAIVATNVGGIPEMVDQGEAALLVPPAHPAELAEAIAKLLSDDAFRLELASRAQRNIEQFSAHGVSAAYLDLYERTLRERKVARRHMPAGAPSTGGAAQ